MSFSASHTYRSVEVTDTLEGRSAIITGASRGIGLAIARALAAAGARTVLVSRNADRLRELALELGSGAIALPCDLTDRAAVAEATRAALREPGGAPDMLINNAGAFAIARAHETSVEDFARMLDVNLVAPFAFARALLPAMRQRGRGHVVTIGSVADRVAYPGNAAYAASKFGLRALHEVLRAECQGSGIRTTLISPGPVDTELWDPVDPDSREGFTPRRRMLAAESVAAAVLYAVSQSPDVNVDELRLSRT